MHVNTYAFRRKQKQMSEISKTTHEVNHKTERIGQSSAAPIAGLTGMHLIHEGIQSGNQKEVGLGIVTTSGAAAMGAGAITAATGSTVGAIAGTAAGAAASAAIAPFILPVAAVGGVIGVGMWIFGKGKNG